MIQPIDRLALETKTEEPNSVSGTHRRKKRVNFCKLSSDPHMCAVAFRGPHTSTK